MCIMGFRIRVFVDSVSLVCEVKAGHYMCNGLLKSCVCRPKESGQWSGGGPLRVVVGFRSRVFVDSKSLVNGVLRDTQRELILASLSGGQVLIDTDRRHHVKV